MATVLTETNGNETQERIAPPFLRRVRIKGYKSISFCDVSLQPLTILVGRNAAGKSNFLDALAFLRDVMKFGVAEAVKIKPRGGWPSLVNRSANAPKIQIEVESTFVSYQASIYSAIYHIEFTAAPQQLPIICRESLDIRDAKGRWCGFEVENGVIVRWGNANSAAWTNLPHSTELSANYHEQLRIQRPDVPLLSVVGTQPFIDFADGLRWMGFYNLQPDAIRSLPTPTPGALLERDGRNLPYVIEILKELERDSLDRVRDYLAVIAPEIESFEVVKLGGYETVRFRLRGRGECREREFDAASMSDGTLRALAALMAAFQIVLPRGFPSVVGIEEPETALHPAAMRALVDALDDATQRCQIVLTTHSADLLSGRDVDPGQVLVVRNRGGQTHLTPIDPASREIIRKELYSLADLQRMDRLDLDEADLARQAQMNS